MNRLLLGLVGLALCVSLVSAQAPEERAQPLVLTAAIEGPIGPATVQHVERAIGLAEERQAAALVLRLNTPGGLADAMRTIITDILASDVPVIGHVAPSGAHAASAGTFILYATHVAAMAPGTNLGAATPVQIGGMPEGLPEPGGPPEDAGTGEGDGETAPADGPAEGSGPPDNALAAKATNDAVALIRGLAQMHGRNADWGERAVREAASLPADEALAQNVIDLIARDTAGLLSAAEGRSVEVAGAERRLALAGATVETVEMTTITRILSVLSNPNVALVLMMIGLYGLIFEFLNPGGIGPGVVGAICLTLGFYALNQLPLDFAGLALIALGVAFMATEAFTPTFGVLGLGGLVAFVLGASMLIDTDVPAFQVSWTMIAALAALSGAVLILLMGVAIRSYRGRLVSGRAGMIGETAQVIDWSGDEGHVWVEGERWQATGPETVSPGQSVTVRAIEGLTLRVDDAPDDPAGHNRKGAT
ncbi:nodulation protein NfeD [Rhodovulum sp. ES.010]|uniref:NfeD family protein n=1 Tax=Rhodovulum sp. ES.010 TaxID=1882821 RepID=UPI001587FE31|nr:nodulation protein NfeD [Rhodovulum sp. ES.010]